MLHQSYYVLSDLYYLSLLIGISSTVNQPILETFLQFIVHCASDPSDIPTVKASFNILARAINSWASNEEATPESVEPDRPLPGFEKFMYEHILRACFEMPLKPEFNLNDAQSVMVRKRNEFRF